LDLSTQPEHYRDAFDAGSSNPTVVFTPAADDVADRTILVAQDDHNCRRALQHYLKRSGYHVAEAASVSSSLDVVFNQPADLVILDFDQSGETSEVLSKIRRRSTVPVIVCSGRASERDRISMLNLGADDVIAKPFSFAELEARVRAVLRRGSAAPIRAPVPSRSATPRSP
jgi:two-component system KDP operon response regulator KdpE